MKDNTKIIILKGMQILKTYLLLLRVTENIQLLLQCCETTIKLFKYIGKLSCID